MNALLALRPCKAFGRSTSGIHARPRKRVRFCCSVKPSQLWWGLLPIRTINEIFRTIPLAFRRVSICVCLVGFASIAIVVVCGRCVLHRLFATTCKHPCLKPLGTHAKASLPCSLLPLHRTSPSHNLLKSTSTASPHTTFLPPLSKGGGLTARHKLLLCCFLLAICPPFYIANFSAVETEGLLYTHQPFQNRTIPCSALSHLPPLSKVRFCRPQNSGDYRRDCSAIPRPLHNNITQLITFFTITLHRHTIF